MLASHFDLSSRKKQGLTAGATLGRPPPMPVVPGDQDVPAGAISREKISSAWRLPCATARRSTASRVSAVRACGPYTVSAVSYTHLRAHETDSYLVCRLLL